MAVTVETLEKLERKIVLTVPTEQVRTQVDARLKRLARTVKMDGFRPGKVPLNVVAQRYGYSAQYEVINDLLAETFARVTTEAGLRVAGQPRISEKKGTPAEGQLEFEAIFEVFPEVKFGDFASVSVDRLAADVDEAAIEKTVDILRKQRRTFNQRPAAEAAADGDRVTVDFEGKIDGEAFEGGKAQGFQFLVGEGQMLKEFEDAVRGMKTGESKTFPLAFPADYHGKDVAGKTADFLVTVHKIEAAQLPEVDEAMVKSLGIAEGSVEALRADIRKNLEREVKFRLQARNKQAVMDALMGLAELDLPQTIVEAEVARLQQAARADLKQRGFKDADTAEIPKDVFLPQAERRVRLGLIVGELVKTNALEAKPEQIKAHIDELASSYEKPQDVARWYMSDPQRLADVQAVVVENNVTEFVLGKVKINDKKVTFEELMGQA